MLLQVNRLSKSFGGVNVLVDVSIAISEGSITSVIGPNGSGKTTLFNVISGFVRQDSGTVDFRSQCIDRKDAAERAASGIGRVWQDIRIFGNMTVIENLLASTPHPGEAIWRNFLSRRATAECERHLRESAMQTLTMLGLADKASGLASTLSYGQQKLVGLGRLLVHDAQLLLIDEPVSGLNGSMIAKVVDLMKGLRARGKTIVMIEHNVETALDMADYVYVMEEGRIELSGPPREVRNSSILREVYLGV